MSFDKQTRYWSKLAGGILDQLDQETRAAIIVLFRSGFGCEDIALMTKLPLQHIRQQMRLLGRIGAFEQPRFFYPLRCRP